MPDHYMAIPALINRFQRKTWIVLAVTVAVASLAVWGYAQTFLQVPNNATIRYNGSLEGLTGSVTGATDCSIQSGYSNSPTSIVWGTVNTGTTVKQYLCIHNNGTDNVTVNIATDLPSNDGSITTPQSSLILAPGGYLNVELDWVVPLVGPSGPTLGPVSFTVTFQ